MGEKNWFGQLANKFDQNKFRKLNETMSFGDYLNRVFKYPTLAYSAHQRLYNMIVSKGTHVYEKYRKNITHYNFFDDAEIPIFGLDNPIEQLMKHIRGAANWHGPERRFLLLHGPVGSSKSTICRLIKRGLEKYSQSDEGAIYSYDWVNLSGLDIKDTSPCPMNDDPLKLIPMYMRPEVENELNSINEENYSDRNAHRKHQIKIFGDLNPHCKFFMQQLLRKYDGDWGQVVEKHIRVKRILLSEAERVGIGTFQPKDPKNQDSTELTGDVNYMKLGHYGVDSDPRCVSLDTEIVTGNGVVLMGDIVSPSLPENKFINCEQVVQTVNGERTSNAFYYGGVRDCIRITTRLNYELICTPEHKLMTLNNEWKQARELNPGDLVAFHKEVKLWGNDQPLPRIDLKMFSGDFRQPSEVTADLAYFFGLWLNDGYISSNEIGYTRDSDKFSELVYNLFSIEMNGKRINSERFYKWMEFVVGKTKNENKRIPEFITRSSKKSVISFVRGLLEHCNGMFVTTSKTLAKQVHSLLLRLGVLSSYQEDNGNYEIRLAENGYLKTETKFDFKNIASDSNVYWLPVKSIQSAGKLPVADISVEDTHNYWANGFVVHNCFSFDGEVEIANRGFLEFMEVLKLDKEFLYDLLGICQERQFKPKKFPQIDVDLVIFGHSNPCEFEKFKGDPTMEALRDRTVRCDIPYLREWKYEQKVLEHDYGKHKIQIHIAPHTVKIAALWAVLTRLNPESKMSVVDKAKLYDGQAIPGWTEESIKEMYEKHPKEGLERGVSARFVQNAIANALVSGRNYVNPFMVLNELKEKLSLLIIPDENDRDWYNTCLTLVKKELDEILKSEVQKALVGDPAAIERLFQNYLDNVLASCSRSKIKNPLTGEDMEPDERLMRQIEEKADIPEQHADDFRRQIKEFLGESYHRKKEVRWDSNVKLARALEKKLFEDTKDTVKLAKLSGSSGIVDKDLQEKIDAIKTRLVKNFGYNEESATDVLSYCASLFSRGDIIDD